MVRTALAIAGSDSGGGAGIQADLKAFARCGVHGTTAITAITAQNTVGVQAIEAIAPEMILAQVRAVCADIRIDAVKVGMLGAVETVRAVAQALDELPAGTPVVVDPVMVAESGARLLDAAAQDALIEQILPRASVITPNLPEARARRAGRRGVPDEQPPEREDAETEALARALLALGPRVVVDHRRPSQARGRSVPRRRGRRASDRDRRRAPSRRRGARLGLHALVVAHRSARAGAHAA